MSLIKEYQELNLKKFNALLSQLQSIDEIQKDIEFIEDIPDDIYNEHFKDKELWNLVETGLDVDTRRHYEVSTSVICIYGHHLGVRQITHMFSEMSSCEDVFYKRKFFRMKPEVTITYVKYD